MLLSPLGGVDGIEQEGSKVREYKCNVGKSTWYFCGVCGVRCFTVCADKTETVDIELPSSVLQGKGDGTEKVKVWRIAKEGFREGKGKSGYFSLNAATLEAGQEGLDLRQWHENGWLAYCDSLDNEGPWRFGRPHRGGMY